VKVAIALLTCGRADYTRQTLESLAKFNDLERFTLIHGDDYSKDGRQENEELADAYGFETRLPADVKKRGNAAMTHLLFKEAEKAGADLVLYLQNDWESQEPIDMEVVQRFYDDDRLYCMRLFGKYKAQGEHQKCLRRHVGKDSLWPAWEPWSGAYGWEMGDIHWGHPPSITRMKEAMFLTEGVNGGSESSRKSGQLSRLTIRPIDGNIMSHIGKEKTVGFMP